MNVTTVTTKGQTTIPEEVRELLDIRVGDKVVFKEADPQKKQVVIEVISKENIIDELYGSLKTSVPYADMKTVRKKIGKILAKKYKLVK
jgi:AbrB family looped-hinge helix DNA binding protein